MNFRNAIASLRRENRAPRWFCCQRERIATRWLNRGRETFHAHPRHRELTIAVGAAFHPVPRENGSVSLIYHVPRLSERVFFVDDPRAVHAWNTRYRFNTESRTSRGLGTFQLVLVARQPSPPSWGNRQIPPGKAIVSREKSLGGPSPPSSTIALSPTLTTQPTVFPFIQLLVDSLLRS